MRILHILLLLCCLHSNFSYAKEDSETLKEKVVTFLRPYSQKVLGNEWTVKIFGKQANIFMPSIPKVDKNPQSMQEYKLVGDKIQLSVEKKKKYDYLFIEEIYQVTKNTTAANSEISNWLNVLEQGGTREGIYRAVVLNDDYRGLENFDKIVSEAVVNFSIFYMDKFLSKKVAASKLTDVNFYTLKRVVVGQTLDIVDALMKNPYDLYDWYAIFSIDLIEYFPHLYKNKLRLNKNSEFQREWAVSAPEQFIKAEIIIKLHMALNASMGNL